MDFRTCVQHEHNSNRLIICEDKLSTHLEASKKIIEQEPSPLLLTGLGDIPVAANIFNSREAMARHLQMPVDGFLTHLAEKLKVPGVNIQQSADVYGDEEYLEIDLNQLPFLFHYPGDGGKYVTSAVWIVKDKSLGRNLSYHRMMIIDKNQGVVRVVENRGMSRALEHANGKAEVAICFGPSPAVLLAAALSPADTDDEMNLASKLDELNLVKCKTIDVEVPMDCEIVLEGKFTGDVADEGPFVDITGTLDKIRKQPVLKITRIAHRKNPVYHALIPGRNEHKILMGMPKELDIFQKVNEVCTCLDVNMTSGGCSWLHAVVKIRKHSSDDARKCLEKAFEAHKSLKHCIVVDEDIDIQNMEDVEWAIATRFQAGNDLLLIDNQPSSSLDPSATHAERKKSRGSKLGLDATIKKTGAERKLFERIKF